MYESKSKPSLIDINDMDATHYNTNEKIVKELLEYKANPKLTNGDGWNAYKLAKKYNPNPKVAKIIGSYM